MNLNILCIAIFLSIQKASLYNFLFSRYRFFNLSIYLQYSNVPILKERQTSSKRSHRWLPISETFENRRTFPRFQCPSSKFEQSLPEPVRTSQRHIPIHPHVDTLAIISSSKNTTFSLNSPINTAAYAAYIRVFLWMKTTFHREVLARTKQRNIKRDASEENDVRS